MENLEVIDADGHIVESDNQLREYMEASYRSRRAGFYPSDNWDRSLSGTLPRPKWAGRENTGGNAESWLDALDAGGLSTAVLFPTRGLGLGWVREPDFAVALARAYNNFVSEEFQKKSPRLKAIALLPLQDVAEAVQELRRAVTELGLVGAMLAAVGLRKPLGHQDFWPIYKEAEKLDCMVGVHATVRGPHYFAGDLFDRFIDVHTVSHPFAQMMQMTSIVMRGVMEMFPKLRIGFLEAGCTWVPYWMGRMDEEWELRGEVEAPLCKRKPSEYVKSGRAYFPVEAYEPLAGATVQLLTPQCFYYASDWPHWDSDFPDNIDHLNSREDLSVDAKRWIFSETAKRLYGLTGA